VFSNILRVKDCYVGDHACLHVTAFLQCLHTGISNMFYAPVTELGDTVHQWNAVSRAMRSVAACVLAAARIGHS
jgi:hypothetical protein